MGWSPLATQFCLELAFGVLVGLCSMQRAPVGPFFYRMMGTVALVPLLFAALAPPLFGEGSWTGAGTVCAGLAALAFPLSSGPIRRSRRQVALAWSTAWCAGALVIAVSGAREVEGAVPLLMGSLTAGSTGAVAGGVGLAMVLGHWYLTVPELSVSWLVRLNRFTALAMVVCAASVALSCSLLQAAREPFSDPFGVFHLTARLAVGLALPLCFAWMTAGCLAYGNTRSATGILYASTVLVLIGAAASISLQDSYGIPL